MSKGCVAPRAFLPGCAKRSGSSTVPRLIGRLKFGDAPLRSARGSRGQTNASALY